MNATEAGQAITTFYDISRRYDSSGPGTALSYARERFEALTNRDLSARAIATLKARGEYEPTPHHNEAMYPPLTRDEHLEVLALGELLARHYRHPANVHEALLAGVSWEQVAAAVGQDEGELRQAYLRWADSQRGLHLHYEGRLGMAGQQHAEAVERAGGRGEPVTCPDDDMALAAGVLRDAADARQARALLPCCDCQVHPASLCVIHAADLDAAERYRAVAERIGGAR